MTHPHLRTDTSPFSPDARIFRAYDIRGVYGESLTEETANAIGRAYGTVIVRSSGKENPTIAMARDGRLSSPALSQALAEGMKSTGAQVIDTGLGPTPMLYFAAHYLKADGSIMVTGSHNPPSHNGFKMTLGAKPFFGKDITALGTMIETGDVVRGLGSIWQQSIVEAYIDRLLEGFNREAAQRDLTVVWDAGNGAAGEVMAAIAARLPGTHHLLYETIDGTFPNHHPDPTVPDNLKDLIAAVKKHKADVGIAFDGDGDRIGAVDGKGRIIWGDQLMMFFSREILARKPGATIIADVKASQTLFDDIAAHGGAPLMWKTGHSLVKAKMAEEKAELAGEMSGHIFFCDGYYGFDDGLYAAVRLLDLLAKSEDSLTRMRDGIPEAINTPEIRIEVEEDRKFGIVEEIRHRLKMQGADVNEVDGVRVSAEGGWWLARASNTQPAIIVRCEAPSQDALERLMAMVEEQLRQSGIATTLEEAMHSGGGH